MNTLHTRLTGLLLALALTSTVFAPRAASADEASTYESVALVSAITGGLLVLCTTIVVLAGKDPEPIRRAEVAEQNDIFLAARLSPHDPLALNWQVAAGQAADLASSSDRSLAAARRLVTRLAR